MSRTIKGNKVRGYEYWTRRNYKDMTKPGRISKKITGRHERRLNKEAVNRTKTSS